MQEERWGLPETAEEQAPLPRDEGYLAFGAGHPAYAPAPRRGGELAQEERDEYVRMIQ